MTGELLASTEGVWVWAANAARCDGLVRRGRARPALNDIGALDWPAELAEAALRNGNLVPANKGSAHYFRKIPRTLPNRCTFAPSRPVCGPNRYTILQCNKRHIREYDDLRTKPIHHPSRLQARPRALRARWSALKRLEARASGSTFKRLQGRFSAYLSSRASRKRCFEASAAADKAAKVPNSCLRHGRG